MVLRVSLLKYPVRTRWLYTYTPATLHVSPTRSFPVSDIIISHTWPFAFGALCIGLCFLLAVQGCVKPRVLFVFVLETVCSSSQH